MRVSGRICQWNDARGFGFVRPVGDDTGAQIFAHINSFQQRGRRPQVGDLVSFEIFIDGAGRRTAGKLEFAGAGAARPSASSARRPPPRPPRPPRRPRLRWRMALPLLALAVVGWMQWQSPPADEAVEAVEPTSFEPQRVSTRAAAFSCDGRRYCSEMHSCAEAQFFLRNCPGTEMDGDDDGRPCEQQWC